MLPEKGQVCGSQRRKETWKSLTVILFRAGVTEPEKDHLDSCSRSNAMTSDIFTKDDITPKLKHLTIQLEQSHINLNSLNNDLLELLMEGNLSHLKVTEPYFSREAPPFPQNYLSLARTSVSLRSKKENVNILLKHQHGQVFSAQVAYSVWGLIQ